MRDCSEGADWEVGGMGEEKGLSNIVFFRVSKTSKLSQVTKLSQKSNKKGKQTHSLGSSYTHSDSDTNPDVQMYV